MLPHFVTPFFHASLIDEHFFGIISAYNSPPELYETIWSLINSFNAPRGYIDHFYAWRALNWEFEAATDVQAGHAMRIATPVVGVIPLPFNVDNFVFLTIETGMVSKKTGVEYVNYIWTNIHGTMVQFGRSNRRIWYNTPTIPGAMHIGAPVA